ncbi:MAG: tRNA uridine-5-carboxymethylaminomethyl(34) synthesis GTPase MnmE [Gammaproteobacteria bacterium]|nr:MAG: tRNA uridine-5-carboxymethylaminomethyl(34) synthesis GTPase MnmE [Gammaproteobacteria bacterium]
MHDTDTIAAVSTPPGRGGIGIVRVSGPGTAAIAEALIGRLPPPRSAHYCAFRDDTGTVIDRGVALFFPAPASFTGEDILELQGHGGPVVMDMLLAATLEQGARPARPGEFSERAFLNGRMDLSRAEAVADLIDSGSRAAARSAMRSLDGAFSKRVRTLADALTEVRAHIEACIDFPEEEIDFLSDPQLEQQLKSVREQLTATRAGAGRGVLLKEGVRVVLAGQPNVGKSSLMNLLAGRDSAIVTDIPGTTRDIIREHIQLDGLPLHVIDTAGIRAPGDAVEEHGVERAWGAIESADALLLVIDDRTGMAAADREILARTPADVSRIVVSNKIDLTGADPGAVRKDEEVHVRLSATTGAGIEALESALKECVGYELAEEGSFMARRRHLDALERTAAAVDAAREVLRTRRAGELAAEELRQAQRALGEITGEVTSDDILGEIFSRFCIGK